MSEQHTQNQSVKKKNRLFTWISWGGTVVMASLLVSILTWQPKVAQSMAELTSGSKAGIMVSEIASVPREALESMPDFNVSSAKSVLLRKPETHTEAPTQLRIDVIEYTVEQGDAIFSIAKKYNISPETLLWSNYDVLQDNPHFLEIGQTLRIPPTNGIWYLWQENDNLEAVAGKYKASVDDIVNWFCNRLDLTNPTIEPNTYIMIPGGEREFQQWVVPTIPRGRAGVVTTVLGPGSCDTSGGGAFGTGYFAWPADNHYLSGNDYWSGHLAIDIAAGSGAPIYASDSGLVVYSGWISGGYGNMVMIDHGNGYQTLYAHLSTIMTNCGSSVYQGQTIGLAGMTGGTSTGPHLHFEIRYLGGFVNPWMYLP